jgi:hypothetical protein
MKTTSMRFSRSAERRFDSLRQMRFHPNQANLLTRGLRCLQESGRRRPRHVPIMARPPWLSQPGKRGGNGSRRTSFHGRDDARRGGGCAQHRLDHADLKHFNPDSADGTKRPRLSWKAEAAGLEYPHMRGYGDVIRDAVSRSFATHHGRTSAIPLMRSRGGAVRGFRRTLPLFFAQQCHLTR